MLIKQTKKLPEKDYYKILFINRFTSEDNFKYIIHLEKGTLEDYSKLPRLRYEKETLILLHEIQKEVCKRLAANKLYDIDVFITNLLKK